MKTLSLETCKRLQEAGIKIKTEKWYPEYCDWEDARPCNMFDLDNWDFYIPAPNLEEAIELLPYSIKDWEWFSHYLQMQKTHLWYKYCYNDCEIFLYYKFNIEAVEKMINYLLDNNLLWPTTTN